MNWDQRAPIWGTIGSASMMLTIFFWLFSLVSGLLWMLTNGSSTWAELAAISGLAGLLCVVVAIVAIKNVEP